MKENQAGGRYLWLIVVLMGVLTTVGGVGLLSVGAGWVSEVGLSASERTVVLLLGAVLLVMGVLAFSTTGSVYREGAAMTDPDLRRVEPVPRDAGSPRDVQRSEPSTWQELASALATAVADSPFVVMAGDATIRIEIDVADAQWHSSLESAGLSKALTVMLLRRGPGRAVRTDVQRTVQWRNGQPELLGSKAISAGRGWSWGAGTDVDRVGDAGPHAAIARAMGEVNDVVKNVVQQHRWTVVMGAGARLGLGFALLGVAVAIIAVIGAALGE
ncbi:MAG: hypothetical protein Q4G67_10930 [Actinomycetia bacterium]|nr:hypothetical protein [Actinomycetes bacterium]